jgi:hypothetical protein
LTGAAGLSEDVSHGTTPIKLARVATCPESVTVSSAEIAKAKRELLGEAYNFTEPPIITAI